MTHTKSVQVLNGIGLAAVTVLAAVGTPCWLLLAYIQAKLMTASWTFAQSAWATVLVAAAAIALAAAWFCWAHRRHLWSWISVASGALLYFGILRAFEYV
jgi:ABC-type nickel/cobalt efflux system permease component RcnA